MGKLAIGLLAFAGGALVGGLFVKWYVETHAAGIVGEKIGAAIFGEGTTGARITQGLLSTVDQVRA
jgi:hypothetical protein